jgi:hypothetical protein
MSAIGLEAGAAAAALGGLDQEGAVAAADIEQGLWLGRHDGVEELPPVLLLGKVHRSLANQALVTD